MSTRTSACFAPFHMHKDKTADSSQKKSFTFVCLHIPKIWVRSPKEMRKKLGEFSIWSRQTSKRRELVENCKLNQVV